MSGETTAICRVCTEEFPVALVLGEQDQFQRTDLIRVRAAKVSSMGILEARDRHAGKRGAPHPSRGPDEFRRKPVTRGTRNHQRSGR
jgi:hypothetical protein